MFPWYKEWLIERGQKETIRNRRKANKYYATDHGKEKHRESNRRFLENNPGYLERWRKDNPDKMEAYNEKARKKRRKKRKKKEH